MMPVRLTPAARAEVRRLRHNLADFYARRRLYDIYREINEATIARWEAEMAALLGGGESKEASGAT